MGASPSKAAGKLKAKQDAFSLPALVEQIVASAGSKGKGMGALQSMMADNPLHDVIKHQPPQVLEQLLVEVKAQLEAKFGADFAKKKIMALLDDTSTRGRSSLWLACHCNNEGATAVCCRMGANPWIRDKLGKKTPLMIACVMGHASCCRALLENVLDQYQMSPDDGITRLIDARSVTGFPALSYATSWNNLNCVRVLLEYCPSLTISNNTVSFESTLNCPPNSTPLHIAVGLPSSAASSDGLMQDLGGAAPTNMDIALSLLQAYAERRDTMQDIRAMRDGHGQQPWQLARNLNFPMSIEQEEVHYLHPRVPLESLFPSGHVPARGVEPLSFIAAAALRVHLLCTIDEAMAKHSNFADESYIEELKTQREMEKKERQARRHAARRKYLEAVQDVDSPQGETQAEGGLTLKDVPSSAISADGNNPPNGGASMSGPTYTKVQGSSGQFVLTGMSRGGSSFEGSVRSEEENDLANEDGKCGICLDAECLLRVQGCKHALCYDCAKHLLGSMTNHPLACPFCRTPVRLFECTHIFH